MINLNGTLYSQETAKLSIKNRGLLYGDAVFETIKGVNMIMDGELDHLPEAAFNLKGTIEEAIEAGEKMLAEA